MNALKLLPLIVVVACSGPSKQDAAKVFAAATQAMTTEQSHAVTAAQHASVAPVQLGLNYSGACTLGGTVAVSGSYDGTGTGMDAAFDMTTTFSGCSDGVGALDGNMHWTSAANGTSFTASMTGSLGYSDANTSANCDFDLHLAVTASTVTYSGTACGYDVQTDLSI